MRKKYKTYLSILSWIAYAILFTLFLFTSIIFFESLKYNIELNSKGIGKFLELYLPAIQLAATWIAIITLKLTFERLFIQDKQLKKQSENIRITYNNIQYNNYYSHQKEFIYLLKNTQLFREIVKPKDKPHYLFLKLYYTFFTSDHRDFNGQLNELAASSLKEPLTILQNNFDHFSNADFYQLDYTILEQIYEKLDSTLIELCKPILEQKLIHIGDYNFNEADIDFKKKQYLLTIYLVSDLYSNLFSFSKNSINISPEIYSNIEKILLTKNIIFNEKENA